jgi:hypothetical protein
MTEPSTWTVLTLKESVDQRFADNQKAVDTALLSQEKAVNAALLTVKEAGIKAEISTEKRFDAVTKSVTELADQTQNLLPRTEYTSNNKSLDDKIVVVTDAINRSSGDKNLYATSAFVTQTVSQSISNLEAKMEAILTPLVNFVALQKGQSMGSRLTMNDIYKTIAAVSGSAVLLYKLTGH